jgi:hypothetical protein
MGDMTGSQAPGELTSSTETSPHPSYSFASASSSSPFRESVTWKEQGEE